MDSCFYTSSLNHKATSSFSGQSEPGFHFIQKFYKSNTKITLLNNKAHKIFDSHKNLEPQPTRITLVDLKSHQANHLEAQEHPNMIVVVPSTPYMCSSSYSQAKTWNTNECIELFGFCSLVAVMVIWPFLDSKIWFWKIKHKVFPSIAMDGYESCRGQNYYYFE